MHFVACLIAIVILGFSLVRLRLVHAVCSTLYPYGLPRCVLQMQVELQCHVSDGEDGVSLFNKTALTPDGKFSWLLGKHVH
jgi:hypothetical protein